MKNPTNISKINSLILRLLLVGVILVAFNSSTVRANSTLGFNYWLPGYASNVLDNANWTSANRMAVQVDLDHIASLGGGVIRLMFLSEASGIYNPSELAEQTTNLPTLLGYCSERNIKVIICFGNDYLNGINRDTGNEWWKDFYGNNYQGFTNFLYATSNWVNGFVDACESSPYSSSILYYDYQNEYNQYTPYVGWYCTFLYDWSHVPAGKRGISVLNVDPTSPNTDDVNDLRYELGTTRTLDFVDFHSYVNFNSDLERCYDSVKARFPSATVLVGEYGKSSDDVGVQGGEAGQQAMVLDLCTRAKNKNIPYNLVWMFGDNTFGNFGMAYNTYDPKDVLGGMSALNNLIYNPDAELVSGGRPIGWAAGSSGSIIFSTGGPSAADAAANNYYARIQCNTPNASVWMNAPTITVTGGTKLFVNSYIRSNMRDVFMLVNEYNSNWGFIKRESGPLYQPTGWSMNNYLARAGSWSAQLDGATHYVIVSVLGTGNGGQSYLDVDVMSASTR